MSLSLSLSYIWLLIYLEYVHKITFFYLYTISVSILFNLSVFISPKTLYILYTSPFLHSFPLLRSLLVSSIFLLILPSTIEVAP